ncbi:MAG: hypothetical protein N2Z62_10455 [Rhodobacteraceae bacterium]|nr:hypothetical protein [Paracoccaceae bacterium]
MSVARLLAPLLILATAAAAGPTGVPDRLPEALADEARRLVAATLGAPHTATFRRLGGFRLSDGGWAVCGEVNSRNLTGLAMGWKPLYLRFRPAEGGLVLARRIVDWPADVACRRLAMGWRLRTRD